MKISDLHLFESATSTSLKKTPQEILDILNAKCPLIMQWYKSGAYKNLIYRGTIDGAGDSPDKKDKMVRATKYIVPKNRKPRDSLPESHELFNDALKQFGNINWRSNSFFLLM